MTSKSSGAIASDAKEGLGFESESRVGERLRLKGDGRLSGTPLIRLLKRSRPSDGIGGSCDDLLLRGWADGVPSFSALMATSATFLLRLIDDSSGDASRLTPIEDLRRRFALVSSSGLDWNGL